GRLSRPTTTDYNAGSRCTDQGLILLRCIECTPQQGICLCVDVAKKEPTVLPSHLTDHPCATSVCPQRGTRSDRRRASVEVAPRTAEAPPCWACSLDPSGSHPAELRVRDRGCPCRAWSVAYAVRCQGECDVRRQGPRPDVRPATTFAGPCLHSDPGEAGA